MNTYVNYANAIFSIAKDNNKIRDYRKDIELILDSLFVTNDSRNYFLSEKVSKKEKKDFIVDTLKGKVDDKVLDFICLLVDRRIIVNLNEISKEYNILANNELDIKEGIIESVRPLTNDDIDLLEETISKKKNKAIKLKPRINKKLISGFKIIFDDEVIDASMLYKINSLNNMLLERK